MAEVVSYAIYGTTNGEMWLKGYKDDVQVLTMAGISDINAIELYNDEGERVIPTPAPSSLETSGNFPLTKYTPEEIVGAVEGLIDGLLGGA